MDTNKMTIGHKNPAEKLSDFITDGQTNLAKWLISLSTGAIVFSVRLIGPQTSPLWKIELTFGIALLIFSIILGVRYVKLTLDFSGLDLQVIMNTTQLNAFRGLSLEEEHLFNGSRIKVSSIIKILDDNIKVANQKMDNLNNFLVGFYLYQERLFYAGIVLIAVFGIYNI
jgi:hypothetical protein